MKGGVIRHGKDTDCGLDLNFGEVDENIEDNDKKDWAKRTALLAAFVNKEGV